AGRKASTHRPFPGEGKGTVSKDAGGWPTLGPSDLAYPGLAEPTAMSAEQIRDVVEA
ncbi:oxidoreductase, partial [Brevibacterium paucivorans]